MAYLVLGLVLFLGAHSVSYAAADPGSAALSPDTAAQRAAPVGQVLHENAPAGDAWRL
jgi:uncharacterized membrane protein